MTVLNAATCETTTRRPGDWHALADRVLAGHQVTAAEAVEILSSQSATRDRLLKLDLYAEAGVKEYWIVTPWPALVEILVLDGRYFRVHKVFGKDQTLVSPTFPELKVQLGLVFDFPLEPRPHAKTRCEMRVRGKGILEFTKLSICRGTKIWKYSFRRGGPFQFRACRPRLWTYVPFGKTDLS